jgi:serine/threonine-protein kinase
MGGPGTADDPLIGSTLGHFRVDRKLGEGGMGVVYRATDERLRRVVALKVLPDALAGDPERRRRFFREARAAAAVSHANIAAVYEIGEADGHVFIAMELLVGDTLRAKMEPGLTHAEALRVAREIAKGLAQAHESGVVHRDLKPENVMLLRDGAVKLLDFGLAKVVETGAAEATAETASLTTMSQTAVGRVMGTPPYMSPEQAEGSGDIDGRSDVFSFGTMLYEMLAGVRPFRGDTNFAVLGAVMHKDPEPLESVCPEAPAVAAAVVARCLKKRREDRLTSGRELAAALAGEAPVPIDTPSGKALPAPRVSAASGMGTALGATLPADMPRTATPGDSRQKAAPRRGAWPWTVGGLVALAAVGALGWSRLHPPAAAAVTSAASASVSAPAPPRCNAEATRLFDQALDTWHTRSIQDSIAIFERALSADAHCAPADLYLALSNVSWSSSRAHFADARAHRDHLNEAERGLLDAMEPSFAVPPDVHSAYQNARTLAGRFPDDAFIVNAYAGLALEQHEVPEARAAWERAIAHDPRTGIAYYMLATVAAPSEDRPQLLSRCAEAVPRYVGCYAVKERLLATGSDCAALERFARDAVVRNPGWQSWRYLLGALAATGAAPEALDEALRRSKDGMRESDAELDMRRVAALTGDYETLERLLRDDPRSRDDELAVRAAWAAGLAQLLDDTGRAREADDLVRQTVRAGAALVPPTDPLQLGDFYIRAMLAGAMTRAEVDAALGPAPSTDDASARFWNWTVRQMILVRTADEARAALAVMPARPADLDFQTGEIDYEIARLRALAGDLAAARRELEAGLARCDALEWAEQRPHALVLLGDVCEHTRDLPAARAAYETVVQKWGGLKPKAVLADRARARLAALQGR